VLRANLKWKLVSQLVGSCLILMLTIGITSCEPSTATTSSSMQIASNTALTTTDGPLLEVNTPESISSLAPSLEKFRPQVQILSPKPDEILSDDRVTVQLKVTDLPLFKHPELGLGNHLHVVLDKQTYQSVSDLQQPLVFKNLAAGTHSLRVFAARPWHESFKNEGAYAQITFHVLTKTAENNPDPQQPLLTYSRPAGTYGAEPIMLDYYLTNAPSHLVATGSQDSLPDWRIRVTVNDQRFIIDRWAPIYLQGFKPGKNWVRLELVDDLGNPMPNVYNDTVAIVNYDPQLKDTLAKLVRGEIDLNLARSLVDPSYVAIKPTPIPTPSVAPIPVPIPVPAPVITPAPIPVPIILPSPIVVTPAPIVKPNPSQVTIAPAPVIKPSLNPIVPIPPIPVPEPVEAIKPIVKPTVQPSSIPTPITSSPAPITEIPPSIPVTKALPLETPIPEVVKTPPVVPTPQPITVLTPKPAPSMAPALTVEPEVAGKTDTAVDPNVSAPSAKPPNEDRVNPIPSERIKQIPTPAGTSTAPTPSNTWQTQANDLRKIAGAKIRTFTNTIPSKAQRFGHNFQIWVGKAINQIQAWRASHVD
jgi:hypothetical protein